MFDISSLPDEHISFLLLVLEGGEQKRGETVSLLQQEIESRRKERALLDQRIKKEEEERANLPIDYRARYYSKY
jgi:hypothetical protein